MLSSIVRMYVVGNIITTIVSYCGCRFYYDHVLIENGRAVNVNYFFLGTLHQSKVQPRYGMLIPRHAEITHAPKAVEISW